MRKVVEEAEVLLIDDGRVGRCVEERRNDQGSRTKVPLRRIDAGAARTKRRYALTFDAMKVILRRFP